MISSPGRVCRIAGEPGSTSTRLDHLASGDGKVVALQAGAPQSRRELDRRARDVAVLLGGAHLGLPEGGVRNDATNPAAASRQGTSLAADPGLRCPPVGPYTGR